MPTLKCWDNSGWIVYLLGKQCYKSNRNLRQKCLQIWMTWSTLSCPCPIKVGNEPCFTPPHGMTVTGHKREVTCKSFWLWFLKNLTLREFRGVAEEFKAGRRRFRGVQKVS